MTKSLMMLRVTVIMVLVLVVTGMTLSSPSQAAEPSLTVMASSKDRATVEMQNEIPISAVQFALTGVKITALHTTDRTRGFLAKFNEQNGRVVLLSTSGDAIAPGKGPVAEIVCDKPGAAVLSGVKIVGK